MASRFSATDIWAVLSAAEESMAFGAGVRRVRQTSGASGTLKHLLTTKEPPLRGITAYKSASPLCYRRCQRKVSDLTPSSPDLLWDKSSETNSGSNIAGETRIQNARWDVGRLSRHRQAIVSSP